MIKSLFSFTVASLAVMAVPLSGAVVLNPATNVIAGDFGEDGAAPSFQTIEDITIFEGASNDIPVQSNRVFILDAPNWRFNAGVGSLMVDAPTDLSSISLEVLEKQLRVTLTCTGTSNLDRITISGVQVRSVKYVNAVGRVRRAQDSKDTAEIGGLDVNSNVAYLLQTAPMAVQAPLQIISITNEVPVLQFGVVANVNYTLHSSPDFVTWSPVSSVLRPTNSIIQYADTSCVGSNCLFYRLSH
jgi:hypothetical protein